MAGKKQEILELALAEALRIRSGGEAYMDFLSTAARNHKYGFRDQLLIHAQRPDATACAEMGVWNQFRRWVNRGSKGIALLVDGPGYYKLRYVFDVSDTNSREGHQAPIWKVEPRMEEPLSRQLTELYGLETADTELSAVLKLTAEAQVRERLAGCLAELAEAKAGSFLEELDGETTEYWLRATLENSVGFMLLERCGCDPKAHYNAENFVFVVEFNTPEALSVLGCTVSGIARDILKDVEKIVKGLIREERNQAARTVVEAMLSGYDGVRNNDERSNEHGTDLHQAGGLPDPRSEAAAESQPGQVCHDAQILPEGEQAGPVHRHDALRETEHPPDRSRAAGPGHDGAADGSAGEVRGRDGEAESHGPDGLGTADELHPDQSRGERQKPAHLQLSGRNGNFLWDVEFYHHDREKNELLRTSDALKDNRIEIAAFFADHPDSRERGDFIKTFFDNTFVEKILENGQRAGYRAYDDMLHIWRGAYMTREREVYCRWSEVADRIYGMILLDQWLAPDEVLLSTEEQQIAIIELAAQEQDTAFTIPQAAIDYVLCQGSMMSNGKYRIYDHFQKMLTPEENITFLKNEYGWGGKSNGIPGSGYWELHDAKGVAIQRRFRDEEDADFLIRWPAAEKRIRELIEADRYLTPAEKEKYPDYCRERALRQQRGQIADEFKSIVDDFNDYQEQLGNQEAKLNSYVLADCVNKFIDGQKRTTTLDEHNFILPLMREAMNTVISQNTHLTERCLAMLDQLNGDLAKPMEPTEEELNPPPEPKKDYVLHLGDEVLIDTKFYDILALEGDSVRLYDREFPLFNQEMTRQEFLVRIAADPWNDKYLQPVEEAVEPAVPDPLPVGRIEYLHSDGRVREQVEYADLAKMEADLRKDNDSGVPMKVTMYVDRQGHTAEHRFVYELDPPLHGTSVIMNPHIEGGLETSLEKAMRLISEFCEKEYDSPADFSDLRNIGVGYTTITDEEIDVQASVDLMHFSLNRSVGGIIVDRRKYDSLDDLIHNELEHLSFEDLIDFTPEQLAQVEVHGWDNELAATYHADGERIDIYRYVSGSFHIHYGSDPKRMTAASVDGPYDFLGEAKHALLQQRPNAKEAALPETEQSFIDTYYVVEDLAVQGQLQVREYDTLFLAMQAYNDLPTDKRKALGIRNTQPVPGSLDFLQCIDGVDTIVEDYLKVEGWQNEEILGTVRQIEKHMKKQPKELAPPAPNPRERAASTVLLPSIPDSERSSFRIRDDALGVGTPGQRYANNVAAIRLLKQLEAEERLATLEEQEVLSRYVGWGGLADCFDERSSKYLELKALLTEEEYATARESTLTAFYTPPVVIRAMYQALENMNFRNGNILEPSCGIGNFIGMLPDSMSASKLYGVELDSISGRIAQQLYQKSSIAVQGYEKTDLPDSFFDAAIGNVPFGQFKVSDKRYDKHNFLIHDYFFARTLDKVRPGGIIAFITSKGTMDKENPAVRKYIAQRADLLGAIRLPNNTFKGAAGTEVTSDILFLQKRDRLIDREPDWVYLRTDENGLKMNGYFVENPHMILGSMQEVSGPYGPENACIPYEDRDLGDLLSNAIRNIHADFVEYELAETPEDWEDLSIPADPSVRNFSYTVVDGTIYYRENSRMHPVELSAASANRVKGLIGIRDCVRTLIEYQTEDYPDSMIQAEQQKLNELYDAFVEKHGRISTRANSTAFNADSSFCLLSSLEILDDEGNFLRKADMFTKRTIRQKVVVTSVDTASEALALSLAEKAQIDMEYMSGLTGKTEEQLYEDLQGVIFLNPDYAAESDSIVKYLPSDEYLSGNVREKLAQVKALAKHEPETFASHLKALEAVQPVDLTASEISVRLGATWLPVDVVQDFMFQLLGTPFYMRWNIHVRYSQYTGEWNIEGKSVDRTSVQAHSTYGTSRVNAYKIIEETLNLRDVRVFDYIDDGHGKRVPVLNRKETAIAQSKQDQIKQAFADWIWEEPDRRERLTRLYNEKFNSIRPREYDGSHLNFVGMNPEITLRPHQVNAIAHILYGGNTLLAHVVGAGKTFEMVAAAQESKRLGLCRKSMFVVPNHLIEQWASEYLQLYPSANILVATKKDFEKQNRRRFCGRIATGDYDAVIIGHSQFEKIPMSQERQRLILERQLEEIMDGITELKRNQGSKFSVKQMERAKKTVQQKLEKLNDQTRKDDVVTFEELGIDRLFVDEAHYYKNMAAFSKMRNVGGISQTEAMKSSDLYMKCRYLDEITGGRGIVFATGTPISNSMVEMYIMQKYLQYGTLKQNGLLHFDAWASTFGETVTAIELAPEGTGYRAKTRFARFYNLPELMAMFKETADIQTADMLKLPVPEAHYHNVVLKPTEHQKELVASLSVRAERVRNKMVNSSEDNMLLITNDGRKLALDQRLIDPMLPDAEDGKIAVCARNVYDIWQRTSQQSSTQMVFSDLSTPTNDGSFNVYDDLKRKLMALGIPEAEIAFIHSAKTEVQKRELFGKVRSGQIRVLLGSTAKMGAGTNVQTKLIALHHIDCPWRPSDLQQREGRIVRQGNENPEVDIYTYVTENTFDSYLFQLVESKQRFIGQIMTSKSPVRSAEDIDETALSYAEIKALCAGNPHIKEKMDLDIAVQRLRLLKSSFLSQRYALEDRIHREFPQKLAALEQRRTGLQKDIAHRDEYTHKNADGFAPMVIDGVCITEKKAAGNAILAACQAMTSPDPVPLGQYRGFSMSLSFDSLAKAYVISLKNELTHTVHLGTDIFGNIQRLDNLLDSLGERLQDCETLLGETRKQLVSAEEQVKKPFPQEEELKTKSQRLDELNRLLNMDKAENEIVDGEVDDTQPEQTRKEQKER